MRAPTLLILAAGTGSRYGSLKLTDPVGPGGETLMDYSIHDARRAGFGRIIFVIRRETLKSFREMISVQFSRRLAAEYVFQELDDLPSGFHPPAGRTKPWGTAQAILAARHSICEPFAVINVNDFYGAESYRALARFFEADSGDYATVGYRLRNTLSDFGAVARGICQIDEHGCLEKVVELKNIEREGARIVNDGPDGQVTRLTGEEAVAMNMWGFTPAVFDQFEASFRHYLEAHGQEQRSEYYITNAVDDLVEAHEARIHVLRSSDDWFGLTYQEEYPRAVAHIHRLIEAGHYPPRLLSGQPLTFAGGGARRTEPAMGWEARVGRTDPTTQPISLRP